MALISYKITNRSLASKIFTYFSGSSSPGSPFNITVPGKETRMVESYQTPIFIPSGISDSDFLSNSYIPPAGTAYLWNNGDKVQYIKLSNTPEEGPSILPDINNTDWIDFEMVEARDKNNNYIHPTSPLVPQLERYIVDSTQVKGAYSVLTINSSSPNTSNAITSANTIGFTYIDKQSEVPDDCNPTINNIIEQRTNEWLQDVDYSVDAQNPINFNQLIQFTAQKASVPQSNYTKLGFINSKYVGSSTTRDNINEYNPDGDSDPLNKFVYADEAPPFFINRGKGPSLGKIPNVELNNAYIAYFNKIVDPYPILNNRTAYFVKYLIDESGTVLDPSLSQTNFSILRETFQLKDYDLKPTRVDTSIQNINEIKELTKLTSGSAPVYKVGKYPVPVLYSQTSSVGYASEISLSGSKFYSSLGVGITFLNLGSSIYSVQSSTPTATSPLSPQSLPIDTLEWTSGDITPFLDNNPPTLPINSNFSTYAILFPLDNSDILPPTEKNTPGANLSDNYRIEGNFKFTTSTIPAKYQGGDTPKTENYIKNYLKRDKIRSTKLLTFNLYPFYKPPGSPGNNINTYVNNSIGFSIKENGIKLSITVDPGGNETTHTLVIKQNPLGSYGRQWEITPTGLKLTPDSLYIEELIITEIVKGGVFNENDRKKALQYVAGGWYTNYGFGGKPVKYDWNIEFIYDSSIVKQDMGVYFKAEGSMALQDGDKTFFSYPKDVFLFFGANGDPDNNWQWARTFTPTISGVDTDPVLTLKITSDNTDNAITNQAKSPFWRRVPNPSNPSQLTPNKLYMSSSILCQAYNSPVPYLQAKLPYNGNISTAFPLTKEPDFVEFDPVTEFWKLEIGDEIRFENNEDFVYTITEINYNDPKKQFNRVSEDINEKLQVTVLPPFEYVDNDGNTIVNQPTNFDFFVVRRWKENKNFVILNQQKPYGFPVTQSSSPGILLPEHRVDKFNINPDLVLKDLIEKRII